MKSTIKTNGTLIEATVPICSSTEKVWKVIQDPNNIHLYHPLIKDSKMLSVDIRGVGAKRLCELLPMGQMVEVITDWEEGQSYTTKVVGGKMLPPFEFMKGTISIRPLDTYFAEATFSFHYKLKYGWLGNMLNALFIKPQFKGAPKKYVNGLKSYVEQLQITD